MPSLGPVACIGRRFRFRRHALLGAAGLLTCSVALAQTPQRPVFRGGVDLIEVDVNVVDDRGRPVSDLLAPEFTVTVDGKPRKVVSAEFISVRSSGREQGRAAEPQREVLLSSNTGGTRGRLIILAVDRESISFGGGRSTMRAANRFLDRLSPNDKVAYISVPQPGPLVDFTSNHALIRKALDRAVGMARRPGQRNIGVYEAFALTQLSDSLIVNSLLTRFCGQVAGVPMAWDLCVSEVQSEADQIVQEVRNTVANSLRVLTSLLEALAEIEGPKSLVWISEGLSLETGSELSGFEQLAAAARVTINVIMLDAPLIDVSEPERSHTATQDRDMQERGLEMLAGMTRGAFYRASTSAEYIFERMEAELSGYYLLGVESVEADGDGKRHGIKVSVGRRGVTVRARRQFQISREAAAKEESAEERLGRTLRSPFAVNELPLKIATYAYQNDGDAKVRVFVATEIEHPTSEPAPLTLGYLLLGPDGKVVSNGMQRVTLTPVDRAGGLVLEHTGAVVIEPGSYTLKLAAIDAAGRRGSVEHPVQAWQMSGVPFAVSDLMLADTPPNPGDPLRPPVEARLAGNRLAAYMELYAESEQFFDNVNVQVDVAADETGPALTSAPARLVSGEAANRRIVSATVPVGTFPPGRYVARAIVMRGDAKVGELARPFHVTAAAAAVGLGALIPEMLSRPAFSRNDVLSGDVIASSMDVLDRAGPELKSITRRVRDGAFDGAARQAFDAGDQLAAMFLRGLEQFANGELNPAATQFSGALQMAPDFAPAAVYLGACYAAAGRDMDAALSWRRAIAVKDKVPAAFMLLADALTRLGDVKQAADILRGGVAIWPDNDDLRRRLALALVTTGEHAEAFATIEPYIARHPTDHEAILVALQAMYAARVTGKPFLAGADEQERMTKYARAYALANGPHEELIAMWVGSMKAATTER